MFLIKTELQLKIDKPSKKWPKHNHTPPSWEMLSTPKVSTSKAKGRLSSSAKARVHSHAYKGAKILIIEVLTIC